MGKQYKQVTDREEELMRKWRKEGRPYSDIMSLTGRSKQTVVDHTSKKKTESAGSGRPAIITEAVFKKLQRALTKLQKKADAEWEVTVDAVKKLAGVTACDKTVLDYFHQKGIWFRPLRQKPLLKDGDEKLRSDFVAQHRGRTKVQWLKKPHAIIDNKHFQCVGNAAGRNELARRTIRGGYRARNAKVQTYMVKRKKALKYPAPGVQVTAAVVNGRVRMFDFVDGTWSANKAAYMYKGPLLKTLRRAFPGHAARRNAKWTVLEDNDPAGYKSSGGKAAKKEANIVSMDLPPRSPDLNVLDYSLWSAIGSAMRKHERKFRKNKKESKVQYMTRLKKTALGLPTSVVSKAVMDIHRRIRLIEKAGGGLIVE